MSLASNHKRTRLKAAVVGAKYSERRRHGIYIGELPLTHQKYLERLALTQKRTLSDIGFTVLKAAISALLLDEAEQGDTNR